MASKRGVRSSTVPVRWLPALNPPLPAALADTPLGAADADAPDVADAPMGVVTLGPDDAGAGNVAPDDDSSDTCAARGADDAGSVLDAPDRDNVSGACLPLSAASSGTA